ncbi:hypothetical protein ARMGADRAFT_1018940 [Armillaria gallica]|uniref:Uncharacterized protein n=1 Tax=Armillaria gallica TaxID=47427 RepID=A0A2H3CYZ6_ARMGA|nr:hypothetical protein ARMGADRAFT_1018940 [Armillaria gallica]
MYSVLRAMGVLEYFGHCGYRPWMVEIIVGYLFTLGHSSKTSLDASVQQEYISYLHEPDNLFTTCSILAIGKSDIPGNHCRKEIKENILVLVRVWRDAPVWDECRCRLQQLLETDCIGFFYQQADVSGIRRTALSGDEITQQRECICIAIETLNAFFSDWSYNRSV